MFKRKNQKYQKKKKELAKKEGEKKSKLIKRNIQGQQKLQWTVVSSIQKKQK